MQAGPESLVARVVQQVLLDVRNGGVASAARLPSERDYADRLKVSRNTVTAAYAELEQQGILRRLQGKGAFLVRCRARPRAFRGAARSLAMRTRWTNRCWNCWPCDAPGDPVSAFCRVALT